MMYDFKLTQQMKGAQKEKGFPVHLQFFEERAN